MADRDAVRRPVARAFRAAGNEAEIDERDLGARKMADEIGPHAGVEAPAMDEHKTHLHFTSHRARSAGRVLLIESLQEAIDIRLLMRCRES